METGYKIILILIFLLIIIVVISSIVYSGSNYNSGFASENIWKLPLPTWLPDQQEVSYN
jgi:hypothetical protein